MPRSTHVRPLTDPPRKTLDAFLKEAGLSPDAGSSAPGDLTIEQILHEKKVFDLSLNFEKLGDEDKDQGWTSPCMHTHLPHLPVDGGAGSNDVSDPEAPLEVNTLPSSSNILFSTVENVFTAADPEPQACLLAATSDRRLNFLDPKSHPPSLLRSHTHLQDSPVLGLTIIKERYLICTSMSGKTVLYDSKTDAVLVERRDHSKYVVRVTHWMDSESDTCFVATAGWDSKVQLYRLSFAPDGSPSLGEPLATLEVASNPECILFVSHPESKLPILLLTRRDSTYLFYYRLPGADPPGSVGDDDGRVHDDRPTIDLLGKQNLAPHSNAWIAFTPSAVALCPTDASLAAVATSAVPHMKLIIVRLLLPPLTGGAVRSPTIHAPQPAASVAERSRSPAAPPTQAAQARADLALQDREAAAIRVHCSTLSSQNAYSTPALCWRPDGSGVWVNSDDGLVRGIEAKTGKVVATLRGHEPGTKIRCLWAGRVKTEGGEAADEERVVSGAFDHKLIIWK
jgi:WD40 repeat protein